MKRDLVTRTDEALIDQREASPAAHAVELRKTYGSGDATVHALAGVTVTFQRGQFTAVMGPSGSGKSTLMHCMAGLDVPATSGRSFVGDLDLGGLDDTDCLHPDCGVIRIGFVFQSFNLVPTLTARENITLPADLAGRKVDKEWFGYLVNQLGIADRLRHRPSEMSGGQQQRCACARALINRPDLIFADEPTGNLDSNSSAEMLGFMRRSVTDLGQSIVMVTHDPYVAAFADRVVFLADGPGRRRTLPPQRPTRSWSGCGSWASDMWKVTIKGLLAHKLAARADGTGHRARGDLHRRDVRAHGHPAQHVRHSVREHLPEHRLPGAGRGAVR